MSEEKEEKTGNAGDKFVAWIGRNILRGIMLVTSAVIKGFVFMQMWAWFVASLFTIHPLKLAAAIGFMFTVQLLTYSATIPTKKSVEEKFTIKKMLESLGLSALICGVVLLSGYIANLFM